MDLNMLGWNSFFEEAFDNFVNDDYKAGRVTMEHKGRYKVMTEDAEFLAEVSGKLRYAATDRVDFPATGDWVVLKSGQPGDPAIIHGLLPRKSKFSRKAASSVPNEQIIATNIDTVFLVNALNNDFNPRRIERYLIMAWESGATPVIVLSKADLCSDVDDKIAKVEEVAMGVPVHVISAVTKEGFSGLSPYFKTGKTIALLGSSGTGRSTMINYFMERDIQKIDEVRSGDDRGRHTTTHRELFVLAEGGILIDTPGMRELQLWESEEGLSETFEDIDNLMEQCYFSDCKHQKEPNCAVKAAIEEGTLTIGRYQNYKKMQVELAYLERKELKRNRQVEKQKKMKN